MDLRGFGKYRKRTWYTMRHFAAADLIAILISILLFTGTILISVFINHDRFFNPFI